MTSDGVHPFDMPDELDTFLEELRSAAAAVPAPAPGPALATLFRDGAAPVATPSPARRWALRVAVAGAVAGFGFGGLGVAGALPAPVQDRVADLAQHVGIDLPDGDDEPAKRAPAPTVPKFTTTTTVSPSADVPGRTGDTPGLGGTTPSTRPESPGRSDTAPGRTEQTPSAEAPGRTGETPAADAPGRTSETPAVEAPGRAEERPSATAPGRDDVNPKDDDEAPRTELPAIAVRRNQTATDGVHLPDRQGRRPTDDGGTLE